VARRVTGIVQKVGIADEFVISGGIGRNVGLVGRIEEIGGAEVTPPEEPMIVRAVGAAMFALDRAKKQSAERAVA
jgi:activator of 2-hydroxyglutaryl-CoA dehydratase